LAQTLINLRVSEKKTRSELRDYSTNHFRIA